MMVISFHSILSMKSPTTDFIPINMDDDTLTFSSSVLHHSDQKLDCITHYTQLIFPSTENNIELHSDGPTAVGQTIILTIA